MKLNSNKIAKIMGIIIGVILFSLLTTALTYAWFTWTSRNIEISGITECFTINHTKGQNIAQAAIDDTGVILFDESTIISDEKITIKNGMVITNVTASIDSSCTISGDLTITLNIESLNTAYISGNSIGAFKYVVASYDPNEYTDADITISNLNGKSFDIIANESITSTSPITLVNEEVSTTTKGYLIIFYVDGDLANNDASDSIFKATISATAKQNAS